MSQRVCLSHLMISLFYTCAHTVMKVGLPKLTAPGRNDFPLKQTVSVVLSVSLHGRNLLYKGSENKIVTCRNSLSSLFSRGKWTLLSVYYAVSIIVLTLAHWLVVIVKPFHSMYRCFGLVLRPPDSTGTTCLVFAEFDSSQPVTSVVNYLQRAMRSR